MEKFLLFSIAAPYMVVKVFKHARKRSLVKKVNGSEKHSARLASTLVYKTWMDNGPTDLTLSENKMQSNYSRALNFLTFSTAYHRDG